MGLLDSAIQQGTLASRPTTSIWGSLYFTTDTGQAFWYDGAAALWNEITLYPQQYTFSSLPGSPVAGMQSVITDSTVATWGTAVTVGGGTDVVLAWFNGTNWVVIGV